MPIFLLGRESDRFLAAVATVLLALPAAAPAADTPVRKAFQSGGVERVYYLYVPPSIPLSTRPPVLVLLHGSGGNGLGILSLWIEEARREGIVLVGPDARDTLYWRLNSDGPPVIRDLVES